MVPGKFYVQGRCRNDANFRTKAVLAEVVVQIRDSEEVMEEVHSVDLLMVELETDLGFSVARGDEIVNNISVMSLDAIACCIFQFY